MTARPHIIAVGLLALAACPAHAAQDVTILMDDSYKPYSYEGPDGRATGIYAEILREVDAEMPGYDIRLNAVPWQRALQDLRTGYAFAAAPPYRYPGLHPFIQPYSAKILQEKVVVYCRDEVMDRPRPNWPEDYKGLTVGNNAGFETPGPSFFDMVESGEIELQRGRTTSSNLMMLIIGRIDCYVNSRAAIGWTLSRLQERGTYRPNQTPLVETTVARRNWGYVGFTRNDPPPYKDDFIKAFNRHIRYMRNSGRITQIFYGFLRNRGE